MVNSRSDDRAPQGAVQLRPVVESDLPVLYRHQDDPAANALADFPPRDWRAFQAHWHSVIRNPSLIARCIEREGVVVGHIGCFPIDGHVEVGYWIGREHWGQGIATAALTMLLDEIPHRPLHAQVAAHNHGSLRVLERCGFRVLGPAQVPADAAPALVLVLA